MEGISESNGEQVIAQGQGGQESSNEKIAWEVSKKAADISLHLGCLTYLHKTGLDMIQEYDLSDNFKEAFSPWLILMQNTLEACDTLAGQIELDVRKVK